MVMGDSRIKAYLTQGFQGITAKILAGWLVISLATTIILSGGHGGGSIGLAMGTIDAVSWYIALGFPIMAGACWFFASKKAHRSLVEQRVVMFNQRFVAFMITASITLIVGVLGAYVIRISETPQYAAFTVYYLPGILISTLVATLIICPIAILIAQVFDAPRHAFVFGSTLFFLVGLATGLASRPASYPELALLGPAQFYRAIAVMFSGIEFASPSAMQFYFGIYFDVSALLIPSIALGLIIVASLFVGSRLFIVNQERWTLEVTGGIWMTEKLEEDAIRVERELQLQKRLEEMRSSLRARWKAAATILVLCMILIPLLSVGYSEVRRQEWFEVIYESPVGGEELEIGEWLFGSFIAPEHDESVHLGISCGVTILDWGNCPSQMRYTWSRRHMTLDAFLQLNETEIEDMFSGGYQHVEAPKTDYGYGGTLGPIAEGENVWALRFVDAEGEIVPGQMRISAQVVLRSTNY
jgi:hypothetical protein